MQVFLVMMIVSFIGAVVCGGLYATLSTLQNDWANILNITLLFFGVLFLLLGFFILPGYVKSTRKNNDFFRIVTYDFQDDFVITEVFKNDEKIAEAKYYYRDVLGYRETKNYIFLKVNNNSFFGIYKTDELLTFVKEKGFKKLKLRVISANKKK